MLQNDQSISKDVLVLTLVLGSAIGAEIAPISGKPWNGYEIDGRTGGPDGVKVYDVNYDGLYDVVSGFEGASRSRVYINPGKDKCKDNWPVVEVGHARHVEDALLTDLDGDGAVDVVSSCEVDAFMLNIHWAPKDPAKYQDATAWETVTIPASAGVSGWMAAVALQLDGKHGLDILAGGKKSADQKKGLYWLEAPANPRNIDEWKIHTIDTLSDFHMEITAADIDHDGDMDAICSERGAKKVAWYENPGTGTETQKGYWNCTIVGKRGSTFFGKVGDVDGDGLDDYCLSSGGDGGHVIFYKKLDKTGKSWLETIIPNPSGSQKAVAIGDIDGDGHNDIVQSMSGGMMCAWASYTGDPTDAANWKWRHISGRFDYRIKLDRIELIDIDGDGDLDVTTTNEACADNDGCFGGVIWWENPIGKPPLTSDHSKYQPPLKDASAVTSHTFTMLRPIRKKMVTNLPHTYYSPLGQVILLENHAIGITISPRRKVLMLRRNQ